MAKPTKPISRFPVPDPETLPADIREVVDTNAAKAGGLHRPASRMLERSSRAHWVSSVY